MPGASPEARRDASIGLAHAVISWETNVTKEQRIVWQHAMITCLTGNSPHLVGRHYNGSATHIALAAISVMVNTALVSRLGEIIILGSRSSVKPQNTDIIVR